MDFIIHFEVNMEESLEIGEAEEGSDSIEENDTSMKDFMEMTEIRTFKETFGKYYSYILVVCEIPNGKVLLNLIK